MDRFELSVSRGSLGAVVTAGISTEQSAKLNGIETGADVTDAVNVAAAGALMKSGGTMDPGSNIQGTDFVISNVVLGTAAVGTSLIQEFVVGAGVTVDGVLIKDGLVDGIDVKTVSDKLPKDGSEPMTGDLVMSGGSTLMVGSPLQYSLPATKTGSRSSLKLSGFGATNLRFGISCSTVSFVAKWDKNNETLPAFLPTEGGKDQKLAADLNGENFVNRQYVAFTNGWVIGGAIQVESGSSSKTAFQIYKNGVATAFSLAAPTTAESVARYTFELSVTAGDVIAMAIVAVGAATTPWVPTDMVRATLFIDY